MAQDRSINDLLKILAQRHADWSIRKRCTYANGKQRNLMEISIYDNRRARIFQAIYRHGNGELQKVYCPKYAGKKPEVVTDLLLDLLNLYP